MVYKTYYTYAAVNVNQTLQQLTETIYRTIQSLDNDLTNCCIMNLDICIAVLSH